MASALVVTTLEFDRRTCPISWGRILLIFELLERNESFPLISLSTMKRLSGQQPLDCVPDVRPVGKQIVRSQRQHARQQIRGPSRRITSRTPGTMRSFSVPDVAVIPVSISSAEQRMMNPSRPNLPTARPRKGAAATEYKVTEVIVQRVVQQIHPTCHHSALQNAQPHSDASNSCTSSPPSHFWPMNFANRMRGAGSETEGWWVG